MYPLHLSKIKKRCCDIKCGGIQYKKKCIYRMFLESLRIYFLYSKFKYVFLSSINNKDDIKNMFLLLN